MPGRARPLQRQGSAASGSGSATVAAALAAAQQQVQQHPPPQLEREQAAALAASDSSSAGSSPRPEPAPCDSPLAVQRSLGSGSLLRHPSLGSGSFGGMLQVQRSSASETSIHGFRGLFKNLVAASKS